MYPSEVYRSHLTPFRFLQRSAYVFRNKPAIVYGDRSWTYPEMAERVNRLASALRGLGVQKGDRVAALLPNIPPMLEAHFGVPLAGGILVAINTRLSGDEIVYILNHSGAKVLIVDTELAAAIEPVFDQLQTVETVVSVDGCAGRCPAARSRVRGVPRRRQSRLRSTGRSRTRKRSSRSTTPAGRPGGRRG